MAESFKVVNLTRSKVLSERIKIADNIFTRIVGLLNRSSLEPEEGLWIVPCNSIHMFGMKFPIDVVFLSKDLKVVSLKHDLLPWKMVLPVKGVHSVLEIKAGRLKEVGVEEGDQFEFVKD